MRITERVRSDTDVGLTDIVLAATDGEDWAWNMLLRRYAGMIRVICMSYRLNNVDVAEIAQTTWLKLFENIGRIRQPEQVGSWLATTARRECLRTLRTTNREVMASPDDLSLVEDATSDAPDTAALEAERDKALRLAYGRLPPRCQQLLGLLTSDESISYRAVSQQLGMRIGSIGPTRGRCLEHLERLMAEVGVTSF